jgi:signal transduction histidine kinase
MIDQILNFSAIEAGDVALILEVVSMHKIIVQIMEFMNPIAEQRGIKLLCDCPKNIIISTDVTKLRQIVVNLVGNGIKFTQHGTVLIRVDDGGDDIALHVEDTGIGIPVEFQDRIFEKFWQVKQGLTRNVGGAGLGLTIVKRFTELLGGEIYVNSVPTSNGVSGSTFTIKLPKNLPLVHVETISK